jgi:hypothetical protein
LLTIPGKFYSDSFIHNDLRYLPPGNIFPSVYVCLFSKVCVVVSPKLCYPNYLIEISPAPLRELDAVILKTAARGVNVTARLYEPAELPGVTVVQSQHGTRLHGVDRPEWIAVFIDGTQFLMGYLSRGGTPSVRVVWSTSLFFSQALYAYVNSDLHHYAFLQEFERASSLDEARAAFAGLREVLPPGGEIGCMRILEYFSNQT